MLEKNKQLDIANEATRELFEVVENNIKLELTKQLNKYKQLPPNEWRNKQLASEKQFNERVEVIGNQSMKRFKNLFKEFDDILKTGEDIDPKVSKLYSNLLLNSAKRQFKQTIPQVMRLTRTDDLYDAIYKQAQKGFDDPMKIRVGNKNFRFKEYMEREVRTTVQTQISEQQLEIGRMNQTVFWVCNVYADCADDHADYQGKIYYNKDFEMFGYTEETKKMIREKIRDERMLSFQDVRDKEPYLTTRPNCRHRMVPVSINQVIGMQPKQLVNHLRISTGSYKEKNYKALQEQRYNERQIRHYKARAEYNAELYALTKDERYNMQSIKDNRLSARWESRLEKLLRANPVLERDLGREDRKVLVNDLGYLHLKDETEPTPPAEPTPAVALSFDYERPSVFDSKKKTYDVWSEALKQSPIEEPEAHALLNNMGKLFKSQNIDVKESDVSCHLRYGLGSNKSIVTIPKLSRLSTKTRLGTFTHETTHLIDHRIMVKLGGIGQLATSYYKKQVYKPVFVYEEQEKENIYELSKKFHDSLNDVRRRIIDYNDIDKDLQEQMKEHKDNFLKERREYIKTLDYYDKDFKKNVRDWQAKFNDKYAGLNCVEDIYDAISRGKFRDSNKVLYGHGGKYYNNSGNDRNEVFANYMALAVHSPELLEIVKKDIPEIIESCEEFVKLFNEVIDNGKTS